MKRVFVLTLSLILTTSIAFAITNQQLDDAEIILREMDSKISILRGYVQEASRGKIGSITLTDEQKQELKDKYLAEKDELRDLYQLLP